MPILSTPSSVSWDLQLLTQPWSHFPYFAFTVNHNIARWFLTRLSYFLNHQLKWMSTSVTPPSSLQHQTAFPFSILDLLCIRDLWGSSYLFKTQLFCIFNFFYNWYVHLISEFTNVKETQLIKISKGFCFLKWLPT